MFPKMTCFVLVGVLTVSLSGLAVAQEEEFVPKKEHIVGTWIIDMDRQVEWAKKQGVPEENIGEMKKAFESFIFTWTDTTCVVEISFGGEVKKDKVTWKMIEEEGKIWIIEVKPEEEEETEKSKIEWVDRDHHKLFAEAGEEGASSQVFFLKRKKKEGE